MCSADRAKSIPVTFGRLALDVYRTCNQGELEGPSDWREECTLKELNAGGWNCPKMFACLTFFAKDRILTRLSVTLSLPDDRARRVGGKESIGRRLIKKSPLTSYCLFDSLNRSFASYLTTFFSLLVTHYHTGATGSAALKYSPLCT